MRPVISVILVSYNDKDKLTACLASLRRQTFPSGETEVIVVDDGSTDGTAEAVAEAFPEVRLVRKVNSGPDNSRLHGIDAASGDLVAFTDADCIADPDWLRNITDRLAQHGTSVVGGQILHRGGFWRRMIGISDFGGFQTPDRKEVHNIPTCNMGIRHTVFAEVTFDPRLAIGGDAVFCNQLRRRGHRLLYDPAIRVVHEPDATGREFFRRAYRYGKGYIHIRTVDPTLPYGRSLRFGLPGIVCITLGRTLLDWYRLLRDRRVCGVRIVEILPAAAVLLLKRVVSVAGAVAGYAARNAGAHSPHN